MFGGIFGKKKGERDERETPPLSSAIESAILTSVGARSIPTMPGAAQKAFKLATDPTAEARDFIEVIESDEALSARVLKIANSVFFDRGKRSETIEECVTVIGMNELRCLLNASALSDIFPSKHPLRAQFWANDVATALIARSLAQRTLPSKTENAFLAGLMHDIGKLLMLNRLEHDYEVVARSVGERGVAFCEAEHDRFVFDHSEAGQLIAERWHFSTELADAIRNHHAPWEDLEQGPNITAIIKAADIFAHALALGHQRGFSRFQQAMENDQLEPACEALKIPPADQKDMLANFRRVFETEYDLYSGKKFV